MELVALQRPFGPHSKLILTEIYNSARLEQRSYIGWIRQLTTIPGSRMHAVKMHVRQMDRQRRQAKRKRQERARQSTTHSSIGKFSRPLWPPVLDNNPPKDKKMEPMTSITTSKRRATRRPSRAARTKTPRTAKGTSKFSRPFWPPVLDSHPPKGEL
ncbi:hypothetical protein DPEC_G00134320 [Dallia pectoralis]|uniref:Uncharacterized protein n=1 Tax=Dallia pectoralis TaxID=75939 RepID=A0ACC2GSA1_DALPE|nr:hypothetical protein DPEC_G00134320 [Dallia pectoralis]